MRCPNCETLLYSKKVEAQDGKALLIDYCANCGGIWFDHWEANRISVKAASLLVQHLAKHSQTTPVLADTLRCPHCHVKLDTLRGENVPLNCTVFYCPNCYGNWFPKGEIVNFKKAQETKLKYFKTWRIPLVSAFSILLPVFLIVIVGISIPLTVYLVQRRQEQRTFAQDYVRTLSVYPLNPTSVLIAWRTVTPMPTELEYGRDQFSMRRVSVSVAPNTFHQVTLINLQPKASYYYRIILHKDGEVISLPTSLFSNELPLPE